MEDKKLKVIFIAGSGRSGSTILQNILGQIDGYFPVGELHYLWNQLLEPEEKYCACGQLIVKCETWKSIFDVAFGGVSEINTRKILKYRRSLRLKNLPFYWIPSNRNKHEAKLKDYVAVIRNIYFGIQETTGSRVIVDSSKLPTFGLVLQMIPDIEIHVLHLIRDPRAVAHSWMRKKSYVPDNLNPDYMVQQTPKASAIEWLTRNFFTELYMKKAVASYSRLNYEKMISNPQESLQSVLKSFNEEKAELPFTSQKSVNLQKHNHAIAGNVVRFQSGEVTLSVDEEWKNRLNRKSKSIVTAITSPLLSRYGYSLVIKK